MGRSAETIHTDATHSHSIIYLLHLCSLVPRKSSSSSSSVRHAPADSDGGSAPWDSVRIARVDDRWRYVGRVHEYLTSPARAWTDLYRPRPPIDVAFRATDPERRAQSQVCHADESARETSQ